MQVPGTQHRSLGPDKETMFDNEMHGEESFNNLLMMGLKTSCLHIELTLGQLIRGGNEGEA